MKILLLILSFLICFGTLTAQQEIAFNNPSFEVPPVLSPNLQPCCKAPLGWFACGDYDFNTPDVQPGHFRVMLPAVEGNYYLSMVARDNDTQEAVSQHIKAPILTGETYRFSAALATCDSMRSISWRTNLPAMYNTPLKLRIWGGNGYCEKKELLAESALIKNTEWKHHDFIFNPKQDYSFITFEAYYKTPSPITYNGNILMDDFSPIILISDEEDSRKPSDKF